MKQVAALELLEASKYLMNAVNSIVTMSEEFQNYVGITDRDGMEKEHLRQARQARTEIDVANYHIKKALDKL